MSRDFELAYNLDREINCFGLTENAILTKEKNIGNYKPRTLIDQTLELIDPTPNIHTLFVQFNARFFWNVLLPVEVKWSNRMTSCAGTCTFSPRNQQCVITLSAPLLKLRPRKDLVETLLHEMIHGYLFLTNNNRDRDGHGPEFCKHMNRINNTAGTKITIYHSFHDEVRIYQQHWWRCDGPCQQRAPYFGTVRRVMNRAPGPSDFWWKEHQQTCGGVFIKIKEPENFKAKDTMIKGKPKQISKMSNSKNDMTDWLKNSVFTSKVTSSANNIKPIQPVKNLSNEFEKLGKGINNVHGWGIQGPNSSNNSGPSIVSVSTLPKFCSSGTLGGSNTGQSNLLNKYHTTNHFHRSSEKKTLPKGKIDSWLNSTRNESPLNDHKIVNKLNNKLVECPICNNSVPDSNINSHIDVCIASIENEQTVKKIDTLGRNDSDILEMTRNDFKHTLKRKSDTDGFRKKQRKLDNTKNGNCPICNESLHIIKLNDHLDECLSKSNIRDNDSIAELNVSNNISKNNSIISISSSSASDSSFSVLSESPKPSCSSSTPTKNNTIQTIHKCLICDTLITPEISLNDHLEDCIGSVFNDDSLLSPNYDKKETEVLDTQNNKYPCPLCMKLISESSMNQHLDVCLKDT